MLGAAKLIAFVATVDASRAKAFYETTLGLTLVADEPGAVVFDANGIMLRVSKVSACTPAPYTVLGWAVPNIRAAVAGLVSRGVVFERFPGLTHDDAGICTFPGGSQVAWFKDPDGNLLSLTQLP